MIHTVLLYANLSFEEKKIIEKRFKKSIENFTIKLIYLQTLLKY